MWKHRAEAALGVLFVLVWWLVPPLLYRHMAAGPDAQLKAISDTRIGLLAGLVGLGALLTFRLSSRADRNAACYSKAIEQLTSDKLDVRLGGIYALEHLAKESARDHPMVVAVLSGFVRAHSEHPHTDPAPVATTPNTSVQARGRPVAGRQPDARQAQKESDVTTDVRAALTVLGRLPYRPNVDRADLSNAHLAAAVLPRTTLSGFGLIGANLEGADLVEVDLERAKLKRANLQGARLEKASLQEADLQEADLQAADLGEANLQGARLGQADLARANLAWADLHGANLPKTNLQGADLHGANLQEVDLGGANLQGAWLGRANLAGANLAGADLRGAYLPKANLRRAQLEGAKLQGVNLAEVLGLTWEQLHLAVLDLQTRLGAELERVENVQKPQLQHNSASAPIARRRGQVSKLLDPGTATGQPEKWNGWETPWPMP